MNRWSIPGWFEGEILERDEACSLNRQDTQKNPADENIQVDLAHLEQVHQ